MKSLFAFLSSLKLAVILLVLLLVGLSAGTIVESRAGVDAVAGRLVYYSWWFLLLQGVFAMNVALSIVDLFPWGKNADRVPHAARLPAAHLRGSVVTYFFKTEGSLFLWEGREWLPDRPDRSGQPRDRHA